MIFAPFQSTYLSSDSDEYEALVKLVHDTQIGGVIAFGGTEPVPQVMLNNTYVRGRPWPTVGTGLDPQSAAGGIDPAAPTSSDFEWGVQMRIAGATKFPRAMAFGAAGDPQLAYEAGKVVGAESRALGVHVDFRPRCGRE
jgi:beta-N-acetylhexosaminidase